MSDLNNFKEGLKGTTLFGGVGILNILISIVKSKIVAILLGPTGMGVLGLFNSAVDLINKGTNFSLRTSAVKDISGAYASGDSNRISKIYSVFRKLILLTGMLGLVVCCISSPYLSVSSFGDYSYTIPFIILSLSFPIIQLSDGLNVLMQGTRNLKLLAKSNVVGNLVSLISVVPIYFLWGLNGVVYTVVVGYGVHLLITWYYAKKIKIETYIVSFKESIKEGKNMLKMGLMISLQGVLVALSAYIVRVYLSYVNSVEEVGLYMAGFYIINTYTGIIFSGMSTEYYPRIASMSEDNSKIFKAVESQSKLSIMLLAPLISTFILLGDKAIWLLYSEEFLSTTMMINISMLGMFFKAPSWCLGYVFLGKGDSKAFFWNEFVAILYTLVLNIAFYQLWGLTGMGLSYLFSFLLYWIQNIIVCHYRYGYNFNFSILKMMLPQFLLACSCFFCTAVETLVIKYLLGSFMIVGSFLLSYRILRDNVDLNAIKAKFQK